MTGDDRISRFRFPWSANSARGAEKSRPGDWRRTIHARVTVTAIVFAFPCLRQMRE